MDMVISLHLFVLLACSSWVSSFLKHHKTPIYYKMANIKANYLHIKSENMSRKKRKEYFTLYNRCWSTFHFLWCRSNFIWCFGVLYKYFWSWGDKSGFCTDTFNPKSNISAYCYATNQMKVWCFSLMRLYFHSKRLSISLMRGRTSCADLVTCRLPGSVTVGTGLQDRSFPSFYLPVHVFYSSVCNYLMMGFPQASRCTL